MRKNIFMPGDIAVHFKREMQSKEQLDKDPEIYKYRIICVALDAEDGHEVMVYRALYGEEICYVRSLSEFLSEVDHVKYPDVKQKYRFEKIG